MSAHLPRLKERPDFAATYKSALGPAYVGHKDRVGELTITVARDAIVEAARILRDTFGYQQLMEIAGADYPERPERFEVNYHFLSLTENHRVRLKVLTDEDMPVPSLTGLWPVAGWLEREVYDMYGVTFAGNTDLRRILTDYGFEGHPLRKDFPQTGYVELRYSEAEKRVVYEPVSLPQDFRTFDFLMPWEGPEYRLPGDEKATPQAPGAPSAAPAPSGQGRTNPQTPANTPKTTDTPAHTGAGAPGDAQAHKEARKPVADKAANAGGKLAEAVEPKPGKKQ
jgi:NADH-quinone oxidoreductase subunit C